MLKSNGENKKTQEIDIKIYFGFIFIIWGIILILTQIGFFISQTNFAFWQIFLVFIFAAGSLVFGASLIYLEKTFQSADRIAAAISLLICISLISLLSYFIITKNSNISALEYIFMILYMITAGVYGFIGVL